MIIEALSLLSVLLQCTAEPVQTNVKYDEDINYVSDSSEFIRIGGSGLSKVLECPDGYVYDQVTSSSTAIQNRPICISTR